VCDIDSSVGGDRVKIVQKMTDGGFVFPRWEVVAVQVPLQSTVAFGTKQPASELAGHYQMSLRDKGGTASLH